MDSTGRIHDLHFADIAGQQLREALERKHGALVEIPANEIETVKAMPMPERRAWYDAAVSAEQRRERKSARKRQRAARKARRR